MRLKVENACVAKGGARRLGPVSLDQELTGVTVLRGHNGAGKSLFLRLIHGLEIASEGRVFWNDQSPQASRRKRGYVFQHPRVMRRSVAANVGFPLVAQKRSKDEIAKQVASILETTGLAGRQKQPAAALSGGELQRMGLARALVTGPEVLLMDEPTASLDPQATQAFENVLNNVVADGTAVILSTHDAAQAERLSDRIWRFEQGLLELA